MKKITLLIALMIISLGFAQVPTSNPTAPPTRNATDVISIYGGDDNVYTDLSGTDFVPFWGQGGWVAPNAAFDISGNKVLKYSNFTYQGIQFANQNISGMEFLHVDIWTNSQTPNIFVISSGPEKSNAIPSVVGSWQSINISVANITGDLSKAFQFKFDGGNGGEIYIDNLYFWKSPPNPVKDSSLSNLKVDGSTVAGFNASAFTYTVELVVGTTTVPQITDATTSNAGATKVITQATAIPGSATVLVTSSDSSTTSTYTVNFKASLPNSSPNPTTPNADVLSIYGDTGGFTKIWTNDYAFGGFDGKPDLDPTATVNQAIKMDFSKQGYGEGKNAAIDISAYDFVHFDYFVDANQVVGLNGDQVRFILIGSGEFNYQMTPTAGLGTDGVLVKGSWQSVKVPLSVFTAKGFSKTNFLQFKLGTESDLFTKVVYFDNIYFSKTSLGTSKFDASSIKMYPNPAKNNVTIEANAQIAKVTVYNVAGQQVLKSSPKSNSATLQTNALSKGVYMVTTEIDGKLSTSKLFKE
jgi:hypothetical protein